MIIGLTGENCAGKGTVADYLKKKGFYYLSLSDVIREELKADGREVTRTNLIGKGNSLREEFGPSVLAVKTVAKLQKDKNYVIDSIRNSAEADELKKLDGFSLWHVSADSETRFKRMYARGREADPKTLETFLELEKLEAKNAEATKQSIQDAVAKADVKVLNNATLMELYEAIDNELGKLSKEFKVDRPGWDDYFMGIAKMVSLRSNCVKRKVAAVIVKDKRIISTGYNGTPRGTRNCNEGGCARCNGFGESGKNLEECFCSHGEENAIVQASYHGISLKGGIIYTTFSPCLICTKMIINAGLKEVIYNVSYPLGEGPLALLKEAGVIVRQHKIEG